ncbi:MAG: hypothetical protein WDZ79_01775 [Candidatus Paceibacterota bacterium]
MKKILLISTILILVLLVVGAALYIYLPIGDVDPETGEVVTVRDYFPIAQDVPNDTPASEPDPAGDQFGGTGTSTPTGTAAPREHQMPALRQLSTEPIAGAVAFSQTYQAGTSTREYTAVRFVDRASGHISEARSDGPETAKIVNETNSKVVDAIWTSPDSVVLRTIDRGSDSFSSLLLTIQAERSTSTRLRDVTGTFMGNAIRAIVPAPSGGRVAQTQGVAGEENEGGVSVSIGRPGEAQSLLHTSSLSGWALSWPTQSALLLATDPAAGIPGYLYQLSTQTGALTRILGGVPGLTASMNPAGNVILYSESDGRGLRLFAYSRNTGESMPFPVSTLPEKCVWSRSEESVVYCGAPLHVPNSRYPDHWYQGRVSFEDRLVRLNTTTGRSEELGVLSAKIEGGADVVDPFLGPNEEYLFFTNKKDGTLWSYRLSD